MVMFDVTHHLEQFLMVPTVDTVMIMVKEVAHFQPIGSPSVSVSCSSSLKEPIQCLWPLGVALKIYMALHHYSVLFLTMLMHFT